MSGAEHFSDSDLNALCSERAYALTRAKLQFLKMHATGTEAEAWQAQQEMTDAQASLDRARSMRARITQERSYA